VLRAGIFYRNIPASLGHEAAGEEAFYPPPILLPVGADGLPGGGTPGHAVSVRPCTLRIPTIPATGAATGAFVLRPYPGPQTLEAEVVGIGARY